MSVKIFRYSDYSLNVSAILAYQVALELTLTYIYSFFQPQP